MDTHGRSPTEAFGDSRALGAGCSPGQADLPDGAWFGWVTRFGPTEIDFDLACLWPGRTMAAVSNDSTRDRSATVAAGALLYLWDSEPAPYAEGTAALTTPGVETAPGLPNESPFWLL